MAEINITITAGQLDASIKEWREQLQKVIEVNKIEQERIRTAYQKRVMKDFAIRMVPADEYEEFLQWKKEKEERNKPMTLLPRGRLISLG